MTESRKVEKLKEDSLRLFRLKGNFQEYEKKATEIADGVHDFKLGRIARARNTESDHILLRKVMQIFLDNGILKGAILQGNLAEDDKELRVTTDPLSIDEISKIWTILDTKYKLSLGYTVAPVRIESMREREVKRTARKT